MRLSEGVYNKQCPSKSNAPLTDYTQNIINTEWDEGAGSRVKLSHMPEFPGRVKMTIAYSHNAPEGGRN